MALKAWHIYAFSIPLMVILFLGVTFGSRERDGSERTVDLSELTPEPENGGPDGGPPPDGGGGVVLVAEDISFRPGRDYAAGRARTSL